MNGLSVAKGSQCELGTLLIASKRLGYLADDEIFLELDRSGRLLTALIQSLRPKRESKVNA